MQQNYTTRTKCKSNISASNPRYAHLSEDCIAFLRYCAEHRVNPIQRHIGKSAEFVERPFRNGNPDNPDYYCVRHLASYSNREMLVSWSLYQLNNGGYLVRVNDYGPPSVMMYHLKYNDLSEIETACIAPKELIADARTSLKLIQSEINPDDIPKIPEPADSILDHLKPSSGMFWKYAPDCW